VLNLGLQMEELIFELADTHLFFNDLEVSNKATADSTLTLVFMCTTSRVPVGNTPIAVFLEAQTTSHSTLQALPTHPPSVKSIERTVVGKTE